MDDFDLELKNTFLDEAILNLEEVENRFLGLESASDPAPLLNDIFRLAHNLKGGSRSVGFSDVAEFTHELESLVLAIQKSTVELNADVVSTLLRSNDWLIEMITGLKSNISDRFENASLLDEVRSWLNSNGSPRIPDEIADESTSDEQVDDDPDVLFALPAETDPVELPPPAAEDFFDDFKAEQHAPSNDTPQEVRTVEYAKANSETAEIDKSGKENEKGTKETEVVRVNLARIEMLNDLVGELIVLQSVIHAQSRSSENLDVVMRQMSKLTKDIQTLSMGLRMLPVKPLVQKLQRVVRDTANLLDKKAQIHLIGEQIDVDKSVLDRLGDPLIHIVRNAVDHGLESLEERRLNGKPEVGTIKLSFYSEGNYLVVEVSDDGKGIDANVLKAKAIQKNLIPNQGDISEKQLLNLIFHPGFSTKDVTTEVSGRGVGMDVVKTNINKLGGQVDIHTTLGKGSTFRIKIPLSLAVIDGLVTSTDSGRFVVPLNQVQETINLSAAKIQRGLSGVGNCIELRGEIVPIYRLQNLVNPTQPEAELEDTTALLFMVEDRPVAVSVKELSHSQQVVIKPLSNGIQAQKGWVGSCILGDGLPTLIISPVDLLTGKIVVPNAKNQRGLVA